MTRTAFCPTCDDITRLRRDDNCARCFERKRNATRYTECIECHRPKRPSGSVTCSSKCQAARRMKRRMSNRGQEGGVDHTLALLALYEALERCATHWERSEVQAKIDALTGRQHV